MKFEIRGANNGVILRIDIDGEEAQEIVYQEREGGEIEAFADFLRTIVDDFGPTTSRYSPKRIYIRVEAGDKYEPPDPSA